MLPATKSRALKRRVRLSMLPIFPVVFLSLHNIAHAQESTDPEEIRPLTISGEFRSSIAYNDNYLLSSIETTDAPPVLDSLIGAIEPSLTLSYVGQRALVTATYNPGVYYFEDSDETAVRHRLQAGSEIAIVDNLLRFVGNADISPRFVTQGVNLSRTEFNRSEIRRTLQTYRFGPNLTLNPSDLTLIQAEYRFGLIRSNVGNNAPLALGDRFPDSDSHSGHISINSQLPASGVEIKASANGFDLKDENNRKFRRGILNLEASKEVYSGLSLIGSIGYLDTNSQTNRGEGEVYKIGFSTKGRWFNSRVTGGKRGPDVIFAGYADITLGPRTHIIGRYNDDVETNQSILQGVLRDRNFPTPQPVPGGVIPGDGGVIIEDEFSLTSSIFRRQRGSIEVTYGTDQPTLVLETYWERRNFSDGLGQEEIYGGRVEWKYDISDTSNFTIVADYQNIEFLRSLAREDDRYGARFSYSYEFTDNMAVELNYRYARRDSTLDRVEGEENIAWITLIYSL